MIIKVSSKTEHDKTKNNKARTGAEPELEAKTNKNFYNKLLFSFDSVIQYFSMLNFSKIILVR